MEAQQGPGTPVLEERSREAGGSSGSHPAASTEVTVEEPQQAGTADEESGVLVPVSGLLQVTERRQPLSSVSSLEVHFDLLDLTELTDMSDQELVEVFADSDDENQQNEPPLGLQLPPLPRPGYLRSSSWTRSRAEREKKHLSDSELQGGLLDSFITAERSKEN
ncbi:dysbindin domain-containing protein 1 isoform X1 [Spea bombifrons]|uniref:dysbindin domain-containing protein 1 isoform X1 n=1 Tax=Spea bombifrons TaxID=233779 RepID=UPI00234BE805|nr:dysbindin domain-containing protein 1 isoform X1 [Spea bombifrons]